MTKKQHYIHMTEGWYVTVTVMKSGIRGDLVLCPAPHYMSGSDSPPAGEDGQSTHNSHNIHRAAQEIYNFRRARIATI